MNPLFCQRETHPLPKKASNGHTGLGRVAAVTLSPAKASPLQAPASWHIPTWRRIGDESAFAALVLLLVLDPQV